MKFFQAFGEENKKCKKKTSYHTERYLKPIPEILPQYYLTPMRFMIECQRQQLSGIYGGIVGYMLKQNPQPEYIPNKYPETMESYEEATMEMRKKAFKTDAKLSGFIAEYGVDDGTSLIPLSSWTDQIVYGFDSFVGLEDQGKWKGNITHQDEFQHDGIIPFQIPSNTNIIPGWFEDTLPGFKYMSDIAKYIHIDCDTYEATKTVLNSIINKLHIGTVITFDDYFCQYAFTQNSQFSAWKEFYTKYEINYEYLYCAAPAVTIKIVKGK